MFLTFVIFWTFIVLVWLFDSPQVARDITFESFKLPHDMPNDLTLSILGKLGKNMRFSKSDGDTP